MCRSACFGRLHAHHQELTTALTASGFTLERGGSSVVGCGLAGYNLPDHNIPNSFYFGTTLYIFVVFIVVPRMLFQSLLYCSNSCTSLHFKTIKSHTKPLKTGPFLFLSHLKPSSGGPWPYFARLQPHSIT